MAEPKKQSRLSSVLISIMAMALFGILLDAWIYRAPSIRPIVSAEEDEEENERGDDDENDDDEDADENREEETIYIRLPDQIFKKQIVVTVPDSDGDGIFDPDDLWPEIHNIFIVQDDNRNGIADDYEK